MLAASADDYSAKQKLKLARCCRTLCSDSSTHEAAIMFLAHQISDSVLYAIIGHNGHKASMLDFLHPLDSPLALAMHKLTQLLVWWGEEASEWALLHWHTVDMSSQALQLSARRHILQVSAGFVDQFEIRFSRPP